MPISSSIPPDQSPAPADATSGPLLQTGSPVTIFLIAGSVLVTLWTSFGRDVQRMVPFLISLSPSTIPGAFSEVLHGEVWRLFTPIFLHYNLQHLGFNMLGMYNLGRPIERVGGSRNYLVLCAAFALLTDLGQYYVGGLPTFGGMSGVLYGLFGYVWMRGRCDPSFVLSIPTETIVIALVWFVACFTGYLGPIANTAHSVGLITGAIWGAAAGRAAVRRWRAGQSLGLAEQEARPSGIGGAP